MSDKLSLKPYDGVIGEGRALAGAVVLLACGQYFVAEAVASAAWRTPPYDYWRNYISDLGVVGCTPRACSPLAAVMNAGFVAAGALCIIAAILLAPVIRHAILRWFVLFLAVLHGSGSIIVGLVHSAPGTMAGTPRLHLLGAYLAIIAGNMALMFLGFSKGPSRWVRAFSVALGGLGFGSGAALVQARTAYPGLLERLAVDTVSVWEVMAGLVLVGSFFWRRRAIRAEQR